MISLVMGTYNGIEFLAKQIESIGNQTVLPQQIIVQDDCSTDGTVELLKNFSIAGCDIEFYRNKKNIGVVRNFEKALEKAKGQHIFLCDQDDIWAPEHIEILLNRLTNGASFAFGNSQFIDQDGLACLGTTFGSYFHKNNMSHTSKLLLTNYCQGASSAFVSGVLDVAMPFPRGLAYHDHWLALCASQIGKLSQVDEIITYYRVHGNTVSTGHLINGGQQRSLNLYWLWESSMIRFPNYDSAFILKYKKIRRFVKFKKPSIIISLLINFRYLSSLWDGKKLKYIRAVKYIFTMLR